MPSWMRDENIWSRAKLLVKKSTNQSEDSFWPKVTNVYKRLGGRIKSKATLSMNLLNKLSYALTNTGISHSIIGNKIVISKVTTEEVLSDSIVKAKIRNALANIGLQSIYNQAKDLVVKGTYKNIAWHGVVSTHIDSGQENNGWFTLNITFEKNKLPVLFMSDTSNTILKGFEKHNINAEIHKAAPANTYVKIDLKLA